LRNFIEMRDRVADPNFILQKKIEGRFSTLHPDKWIPLYSMVTFSHIPYSEALEKGDKQEAIMQKVLALPNIEEKWDSDLVEQLILNELN
jgi:kynurenine 3-monooxygenase